MKVLINVNHLFLIYIFTCMFVFNVNVKSAEVVNSQNSAVTSVTGKKLMLYPMIMMADDPLVKKVRKWQKKEQAKAKKNSRNNKKISKNALSTNHTKVETSQTSKTYSNEPHIIKLETPENEAKSTNVTKSFVFNDITTRGNSSKGSLQNLAERNRQIEKLRHVMARK